MGGYLRRPMKKRNDIAEYLGEAIDKVWLMRSREVDNPVLENRRRARVENILRTYDDIPDEGYTDWECGYWNGIMAALRWALDDEKDFLDT